MHGNVAEWCRDWYKPGYPRRRAGQPDRPGRRRSSRVVRGGSFKRPGGRASAPPRAPASAPTSAATTSASASCMHPVRSDAVARRQSQTQLIRTGVESMKVNWRGVFPAVCTQFHADYSLNIPGTLAHIDAHARGRHSRPRDDGQRGREHHARTGREAGAAQGHRRARPQAGAGADGRGGIHDRRRRAGGPPTPRSSAPTG